MKGLAAEEDGGSYGNRAGGSTGGGRLERRLVMAGRRVRGVLFLVSCSNVAISCQVESKCFPTSVSVEAAVCRCVKLQSVVMGSKK